MYSTRPSLTKYAIIKPINQPKGLIIILIYILILIFTTIIAIFLITGLTGAPYVPTHRSELTKSIDKLYPLKSNDLLIDLGSGDGLVLDIATKHHAHALGLELNPILALLSKFHYRHNPKITIKCRNFYHFPFPENTTIIYAFAVGPHIEPIHRKIQREADRLNKPLYFISNAFDLKTLKPQKKSALFISTK